MKPKKREARSKWGDLRWIRSRIAREFRSPSTTAGRLILGGQQVTRSHSHPDADRVLGVYVVRPSTASYDFCDFLADVVWRSRALGDLPISILLLREDPDLAQREDLACYNTLDEVEWRLWNLLVPLAARASLVRQVAVGSIGDNLAHHFEGAFVYPSGSTAARPKDWVRTREDSPWRRESFACFSASQEAVAKVQSWVVSQGIMRPIVVINLRQRALDPTRNSSLRSWIAFASYVTTLGYQPVLVPDTGNPWPAMAEDVGVPVFAEAALNLDLRLALYETAFCSFFYSNGPAALAMLDAKADFIILFPPIEESLYANQKNYRNVGLPLGVDRLAYPAGVHVVSWHRDDYHHIVDAFEVFVRRAHTRQEGATVTDSS